jgi:hypothetical protein
MADDQDRQVTASERFYAAIGKPHPGPLSPEEAAEFERQQDEVDADLARRYGGGQQRHAA